MAELGHEVVGIDVDSGKVEQLNSGTAPFHEPGFDAVLARNVRNGRLRFSTSFEDARGASVHFIGVGTPQVAGGYAADLTYVDAAVDSLVSILPPPGEATVLVVGKSTVPVGTASALAERLASTAGILVWNPEFLREGFAVKDTLSPDRIVYGLPQDEASATTATAALDSVYSSLLDLGITRLTTDYATAELVKVAANSFLATKISFINAMAELCEATGADVTQLAHAIGMDDRIGPKFLRAGIGFGGGCLPKDIRAFIARAEELGVGDALAFLREVDAINDRRRDRVVALAREVVGGSLSGRHVAILGAAFKPDSDDMRNSPALDAADRIASEGARVVVTDPAAGPVLARQRQDLEIAEDAFAASAGADVVLLLTEWRQFRELDPVALGETVRARVIVDGRNVLDPAAWRAAGWTYRGMGRP
ncbi:UDP-glucose/GDP-mannose dehydrogenase family protein [Rarobacter faecitabidus]